MVQEGQNNNIISGGELEEFVSGSLGELALAVLKVYADSVLQVDGITDEPLTGQTILTRSIQLAKWLKSRGVAVNDSVSICSENRLEFCIVPLAAFYIGATFAPLNPDYTPGELKHVLGLSRPKVVFCSERTVAKLNECRPQHPYIKDLVLFGSTKLVGGVTLYRDIIKGACMDDDFEATEIDPKETVATILCSSGTTGLPKGVMTTHHNMTCYINVSRMVTPHIVENDDPKDAMMGLIPFFHSFGFMLMFLNILRGKCMVVLSKFKPKLFLDAIVNHHVARMIVPPPVLLFLLKHPLVKEYDLSCIKEIRSGAAPMGKEMEQELQRRFKVKHVSQAYGMTETTLGTLVTPPGEARLGSVGKIVPGMLAKVIDENGVPLGAFQEGELCFKGPLIMKGYVGDVRATASTIDADGWLHTGDVAYYDNDGYFFIVDRIKELIKYKGFQVAPAELEALLLTHPAVQDAAVIGLPNEDAGELPLAFVVRKAGRNVSEKEIEKFVADSVSQQKRLRGGVFFVEEIARNPTGKILRRVLKQKAISMVKAKL